MNKSALLSILLALPLPLTLLGCPTRVGPYTGSGDSSQSDATAGSGGANAGAPGGSIGAGGTAGGASTFDGAAGIGAAGVGAAGIGAAGIGAAGIGGAAGAAGGSAPTCSPACSPMQICVNSKCLLDDGESCALSSQCASGVCSPFYVDADGDGYGAGSPVGFCGTATPIGYASQNGDCCDDASHAVAKLIHPGAGFQTTSAAGVCNVTWDYDCDGTIETSKQTGMCDSESVYPDHCINVAENYPESDCGIPESTESCIAFGEGGGTCTVYPSPDKGTLGCR